MVQFEILMESGRILESTFYIPLRTAKGTTREPTYTA